MVIQNGATLQYQGLWFGDDRSSGDYLVSTVSDDLSRAGFSVVASSNNGGFKTSSGSTFGVSMTLKVNNGTGFASEDDVLTLMHTAVLKETGKRPDLDAIPIVNNQQPSTDNDGTAQPGGTNVPTGQSSVPGAPGSPGALSKPGLWSLAIPQWLKNLFKFPSLNLNLTPLLIAILGIGILIAVIFITMPRKIVVV